MFHIKQDNYEKRPTAEQRKVLHVLDIRLSPEDNTRIKAHLKIAETIANSAEKKAQLKAWQQQRKIDRAHTQAYTEEAHRRVVSMVQATQEETNASR